jgi:pyridoxine 5-phosphate synthase
MPELIVNLDSVALLREGGRALDPDPVQVAAVAEAAGAQGIAVQLREDRRHVQDRDVRLLKETVKTSFTLTIAPRDALLVIAEALRPDWVNLVPGGDAAAGAGGPAASSPTGAAGGKEDGLRAAVETLRQAGIRTSLLIQPDLDLVKTAAGLGVQAVSLHAGAYAAEYGAPGEAREREMIQNAAEYAQKLGLRVRVAAGIDYRNGEALFALGAVHGFEVGHAIVARSVLVGVDAAVRELLGCMRTARAAGLLVRA